jgi:hypothetical protein
MTTVTLSLFAGAGAQFLDNSGNVLTGGLIYSYAAGTTTPLAIYTSSLGTTAHPNPIILDASGRVPGGEIWLTTGYGYKFVTKDANNVLIGTYDNIPSSAQPPITNDASSIAYEQGYIVTAGAFVVGSTYLINTLGTTNFTLIGATSNTVGLLFTATGVGTGTGTAKFSRTVQTKLQEMVSVKDFGAVGNGTTDDLAAINAAIASFPTNLDTTYNSFAGTVFFPPGDYYCSGSIIINRQVKLLGSTSPDGNDLGSSRIRFPANVTGIVINEYRTSPNGKDGEGTIIENLGIYVNASFSGTGSGVWMRSRSQIKNCVFANFGEHGIRIDATSGGSTNQGNANLWYLDRIRCFNNGLDGLYVNGADANAGLALRVDCSNNNRNGIRDSSFLGNTYVGCHCANNGNKDYLTTSANANTSFVGCYVEGGGSSLTDYANIYGGVLAGRSTGGQILGNGFISGLAVSTDRQEFFNVGAEGGVNSSVFQFYSNEILSNKWRFVYKTGHWGYTYANGSDNGYGIIFYDALATTANGYARTSTGGDIGLSNYYLGSSMLLRDSGAAAPTTGTYKQGDIVYNTAPVSGGYIGWVCVTSGTPGTWKTFGLIS